jgi:TetR/AcrR family transcriptional regulator
MMKRTGRKKTSPHVRQRDSGETQATILRAAEEIYAEHGLAGARIDAIAAAAGVNKALLYYYFQSKEGLYEAVIGSQLRDFGRQVEKVLTAQGPAGPILLRYVGYHFDFIGTHPHFPRIFQRMMMEDDRALMRIAREHSLPLKNLLVGLLERGMKSGELRHLDPGHAVVSIAGLTGHYFNIAPAIRAITGEDPFSKANLARRKAEVLSFIRYALFQNPEVVE